MNWRTTFIDFSSIWSNNRGSAITKMPFCCSQTNALFLFHSWILRWQNPYSILQIKLDVVINLKSFFFAVLSIPSLKGRMKYKRETKCINGSTELQVFFVSRNLQLARENDWERKAENMRKGREKLVVPKVAQSTFLCHLRNKKLFHAYKLVDNMEVYYWNKLFISDIV